MTRISKAPLLFAKGILLAYLHTLHGCFIDDMLAHAEMMRGQCMWRWWPSWARTISSLPSACCALHCPREATWAMCRATPRTLCCRRSCGCKSRQVYLSVISLKLYALPPPLKVSQLIRGCQRSHGSLNLLSEDLGLMLA